MAEQFQLVRKAAEMQQYTDTIGVDFDIGKMDQMFTDEYGSGHRDSVSADNWMGINAAIENQIFGGKSSQGSLRKTLGVRYLRGRMRSAYISEDQRKVFKERLARELKPPDRKGP